MTEEEMKAEIKKLRDEAAGWRTKLRGFEEAFKGFTEPEQELLLTHLATAGEAASPADVGQAFLKLAEDLGVKPEPAPAPEPTEEETNVEGLTLEEIKKLLDERDQAATQRYQEEARAREVEAIHAEIEGLGFPRDSEGARVVLAMAETAARKGETVDFKVLAEKVRPVFGVSEAADTDAEGTAGSEEPAGFPKTGDVEVTHGGPVRNDKDWVAEAVEQGRNPLKAAAERARLRLEGTTVVQ